MRSPLRVTILGLSITSSWGNGHATTYRALVRGLCERGHSVLFLEREMPWYAENRDLPKPPLGTTRLYTSLEELADLYRDDIRESDLVIVGSYVPDAIDIGRWINSVARKVTAFYDIDTPVTLAHLKRGRCEYLTPELIAGYDCYLSFTGGPTLAYLERVYGSPMARALYCSVDPELYIPKSIETAYDLGYLGTYSDDRQPPLDALMLEAARTWIEGRFVIAGAKYPDSIDWPTNVERIEHVPPHEHSAFYNAQRFTMNITRADMIRTGFAPSVRLFEAAACGVPIISDWWEGLDTYFRPGHEILISRSASQTCEYLHTVDEAQRSAIGTAARQVVLDRHTARKRAEELEDYFEEAASLRRSGTGRRMLQPQRASIAATGLPNSGSGLERVH